jgi:GR25 family glycosyltransferase involved in LPS biosynthesis
MNYVISILLIIIVIIYIFFYPKLTVELFNNTDTLDLYVITLGKEERITNIEKQQRKINNKIKIFNAVNGKKLDYNKLIASNIISDDKKLSKKYDQKMGQIGCYLSHLNIYKKIKNDNKSGFTVIFEDDFLINTPDLKNEIKKSINTLKNKNIDFDFIFLGNLRNNHGKNIKDNLYYLDKNTNLYGTHGYLINNNKIDKIINNLSRIYTTIDDSIQDLSYEDIFNTIVVYPNLIDQERLLFKSTIEV